MLQMCKPPTGWPGKLVAANSGGPDSTCLSFLLNDTLRKIKTGCEDKRVAPGILLLSGVHQHGTDAVAFGHHADDRLETFLTRLANSTRFVGLGGMKLVRRFGMDDGSPGQMGRYGICGMQRWTVRPLLSVSKDRVFATCDEHGLDYVTDETNFQPGVTLRDAVSHALAGGSISDDIRRNRTLRKMATNAERLEVPLTFPDGVESLRLLASDYASKIGMIGTEAHTLLRGCTIPSPPSTIHLPQDKLSRITNSLLQ
ncbi:adenine nucleotide alpha hydrolases-like protein [Thelephora ganbajun]|uniref:Adenine nucleotide alpha hydrolases-like protein n=1 Tax=Thelephora ganbajun TaxID=370292 RepID=A0ACB6Z6R1_THEGA|nr:adenine nucleotide alpha hydrolases-like protein [Thelephora ganbajun]